MKRDTGQNRAITSKWRPATQAVRGGTWRSEQGETSEAIYVTSGYSYDDAQTVAARFAGEQQGMTYSRTAEPDGADAGGAHRPDGRCRGVPRCRRAAWRR
jgi:O-succinylhomoserine sulfhydrylase